MDIDLPWAPRTRQVEGNKTEAIIAKKRGARLHPRSGAGNIKEDASTDDIVFEIKDANLTYTLKGAELETVLLRATRQSKEPRFIVYFTAADITADISITRGKN